MVTSSKRTYASKLHLPVLQSVSLTPQQATVDPCLCWRLPNTHKKVWLLWGHFSFLLGPGMHKVLCVPFKSVSPVLQKFCNQFPLDLKVKFPGGSQSLLDPQVGKSGVSPRTFTTVPELLWYNCSPVCGSPVSWLYSGANGNLLQEWNRNPSSCSQNWRIESINTQTLTVASQKDLLEERKVQRSWQRH